MIASGKRRTPVVGTVIVLALMLAHAAQARTIQCGAGDVQCLIFAINEANANGQQKNTIRLAPGTYTLTDVDNDTDGPNGLPSIISTLTISVTGNQTASLTRDSSAPNFRLFHVAVGGNLTLKGVSLSNGRSLAGGFLPSRGAALLNDGGVVSITDSAITENSALSDGGGFSPTAV
jgi:hypothetical protein